MHLVINNAWEQMLAFARYLCYFFLYIYIVIDSLYPAVFDINIFILNFIFIDDRNLFKNIIFHNLKLNH
jgi:hypothetical protein